MVPFFKWEQPRTKASQRAKVNSRVITALLVFILSPSESLGCVHASLNDCGAQVVRQMNQEPVGRKQSAGYGWAVGPRFRIAECRMRNADLRNRWSLN